MRPQTLVRDAALMGLAYGSVSFLVLEAVEFGYPTGSVFWPGAGLTLGVLLRRPRRTWPALLAGVFVAEVLVDLTIPVGLGTALVWGVANVVEPAVGAWLLTRKRRAPYLADVAGIVRFLAFGVVVGPWVGSIVGATAGWVTDIAAFWPTWPRWWVGDAVGVLLVAPAIIVWRRRHAPPRAGRVERHWIVLSLIAATVVSLLPWPGDVWQQGLPYLIAPMLVIVALRLGPEAITVGLAGVGLAVNGVTAAGIGPFAEHGTYGGLIVAQGCLAAAAFAGLTVMALSRDLVSLRELGEHRSAMAHVLAHELKNPVASILGHAELLEPDASAEETLAARGAIERGARRISRTVDDILALARIDNPDAERILGPVDLVELVRDAVALIAATAERGGVHLEVVLREPRILVTGERDELDKMVQNLVSNAVKYSAPGGTVTVTGSIEGDQAVLTCRDEGIGIAPEDQTRLFDEFFRSSDPQARARPGTGLGLSIVLRVVGRHQGSIDVESQLGAGSVFTVRIPCRTEPGSSATAGR